MAYPFTDTPKIGVDLNNIQPVAGITDGTANAKSHRLGSQVWGADGRRWVYAQANATIAAGTAVVTINPTTFLATATGGAYTAQDAMVSGDRGWFSAAAA